MVFCVIWMTANTQHFCESYKEKNQKMIVYNDADRGFLLFIIDKKYWKIRVAENGTELQFSTEDKVPIGSSDLLLNDYRFAVKIVIFSKSSTKPQKLYLSKSVAFYKVLNVFLIFVNKI